MHPHIRLMLSLAFLPLVQGQPPTFKILSEQCKIKFFVKASVDLEGIFKNWDSTLTFTSSDLDTGVLRINIQADSVDTGSGMKNGKLKGGDFFDVKHNPQITFISKKITSTGPDTFSVEGDFTIRGVTKPETITMNLQRDDEAKGTIQGKMAFDRKEYGMTKGIPFIKIADRVEVEVDLLVHRTSGPPVKVPQ